MNIYQPWKGVNTGLQGGGEAEVFFFKPINWDEVDVINGHLSPSSLSQEMYVTAIAERDL